VLGSLPSPRQIRYLTVQEECHELARWLEELDIALHAEATSAGRNVGTVIRPREATKLQNTGWKGSSARIHASNEAAEDEIDEFLSQRDRQLSRTVDLPRETLELVRKLAWLNSVVSWSETASPHP
jgi:hypothetical protein